MRRILAAADVGSNTAHLLVAAVDGSKLRRIRNESVWLSLGQVVSRSGEIPRASADELVAALRKFRIVAAGHRAEALVVFATEAVRRAANHADLLARIERETGVVVDVISPREEAEFSLAGARIDTPVADPGLFLEVGGGSTQVVRWVDDRIAAATSLSLGTGVLTDLADLRHPCPVDARDRMDALIEATLAPVREYRPVVAVTASGGVARGMVRALHPDGERRVALEELDYVRWASAGLARRDIERRFGVKPQRASTLLPGSSILAALLRAVGQNDMVVSEFGVREGAILALYQGRRAGWRP